MDDLNVVVRPGGARALVLEIGMKQMHPPRHRRLLVGILAFMFLVVLPGPALADPAGDLLKQAIVRYIGVDFRGSLGLLHEARARDATRDPRLLGKIHLYIGCNHAELGQDARAREAFAAALGHDPALDLDPQWFKPSLVKMFRQVRRGMHGQILVTAGAFGAVVLLDGREVGTAPFRGRASVGQHTVEVRSGAVWEERTVVVAPGKLTRVNVRFKLLTGRLTVRSRPAGATVFLDGKTVGVTPLERKTVSPGEHRVTIKKAGHGELVRRIKVVRNWEALVVVALEPLAGSGAGGVRLGASRPAAYIGLGVGLACVVTAGFLYGLGLGQRGEAHDLYSDARVQEAIDRHWEDVEAGQQKITAGHVLVGVGAAALGFAVYRFLSRRSVPRDQTVDPYVLKDGKGGGRLQVDILHSDRRSGLAIWGRF